MSKRIISTILMVSMFLAICNVYVVFGYNQGTQTYDTSIFEGNATYLIHEPFDTAFTLKVDGKLNSALSGWDVDYRAGSINITEGVLHLCDGDDANAITLERKFLEHKGNGLVFESAFRLYDNNCSDFGYEFFDKDGKMSLKLVSKDGSLCYTSDNNSLYYICDITNGYSYIKLNFSLFDKSAKITVNGQYVNDINLNANVDSLSYLRVFTGVAQDCYVDLQYINLYTNYLINEHFNTVPEDSFPADWSNNGCSIVSVNGSDYLSNCRAAWVENSSFVCKDFSANADKYAVNYKILFNNKADGVYANIASNSNGKITISSLNGNLYCNGRKILENYRTAFWYDFKYEIDKKSKLVSVYLNKKNLNISFTSDFSYNHLEFGSESNTEGNMSFLVGDVEAYCLNEYEDYVSEPHVSESEGYEIGMVMYPMWREGGHYGWDTISPYEDTRKPYLGYYTEGSPEVADWDIKWMSEHGIDYQIFPFVRPSGDAMPVKRQIRGEAFNDGYFNAKYRSYMDFAIMYSEVSKENLHGIDDFKNNILPYWIEYYFRNPQYKTVNNCPIVYMYDIQNIISVLSNYSEDGIDAFNQILVLLRDAIRQMGFDDVIVAVSGLTDEIAAKLPTLYKWAYNWTSDDDASQITKIERGYSFGKYIASISQGFDTTPWRLSTVGQITPDELGNICDYFIEKTGELRRNSDPRSGLLTLNCWNEYGEGHYFAPSTLHGFDYLNVIRNKFTNGGVLVNEELPSDVALARMDVLYPGGRKTLKTKIDKVSYSSDEITDMNLMSEIKFLQESDVQRWNSVNCGISFDNANNALTGVARDNDAQISIDLSDRNIDMSKINAIKITCYAKGSSQVNAFFTTTEDDTFRSDNTFYSSMDITASDNYRTYVLVPINLNKFNRTLKKLRIDFDDSLYKYGKNFGLKSIQFLGCSGNYAVMINNKNAVITSNVNNKNNTLYIPAYRMLVSDVNAKVKWDSESKTLTAEKNNTVVKFQAGNNVIKVNNRDEITQYPPYYSDGNIYISYSDLLSNFGYDAFIDEDQQMIKFTEKGYKDFDKSIFRWEFDSVDTQGWYGIYTAKLKTEDGCLRVSGYNNDPIIRNDGLSIDTEQYNYFFIRMKNTTKNGTTTVRFFDENNNHIDYSIYTKGNFFSDYAIDLSNDENWKGMSKVVSIRIDPSEAMGVTYIDRIVLSHENSADSLIYSASIDRKSWKPLTQPIAPVTVEPNYSYQRYSQNDENSIFYKKIEDLIVDRDTYVRISFTAQGIGSHNTASYVQLRQVTFTEMQVQIPKEDLNDGQPHNYQAVFELGSSMDQYFKSTLTGLKVNRYGVGRNWNIFLNNYSKSGKIIYSNVKLEYLTNDDEGTSVVANVKVKNNESESVIPSGTLIIAEYDKGVLSNIKYRILEGTHFSGEWNALEKYDSRCVSIKFDKYEPKKQYKVFMFNSLDEVTPLAESQTLGS